MLTDHLREVLLDQARTARLVTYRELADHLGLEPPQAIRRITQALETLMAEDVAAGRPLLAALCVSRRTRSVPARGFFMTAEALGVFAGDPEGPEAGVFHARELARALDFYRRS